MLYLFFIDGDGIDFARSNLCRENFLRVTTVFYLFFYFGILADWDVSKLLCENKQAKKSRRHISHSYLFIDFVFSCVVCFANLHFHYFT